MNIQGQSLPLLPASSSMAVAGVRTGVQLPADIPLRRDASTEGPQGATPVWILLTIALAIASLFLFLQRKGARAGSVPWLRWMRAGSPGPSTLKIVERMPLGQHATLHVVQWRGDEMLLACTPHAVNVLVSKPIDDQLPRAEAEA